MVGQTGGWCMVGLKTSFASRLTGPFAGVAVLPSL
jgi:hypothetical protein